MADSRFFRVAGPFTLARLAEISGAELAPGANPDLVVTRAVRGMMPKTKLGRAMMKKLKVYAGTEHPHAAQQPVTWQPAERGGKA